MKVYKLKEDDDSFFEKLIKIIEVITKEDSDREGTCLTEILNRLIEIQEEKLILEVFNIISINVFYEFQIISLFDNAVVYNCHTLADKLYSILANPVLERPFITSCKKGSFEGVKYVINKGGKYPFRINECIRFASDKGSVELVQYLIDLAYIWGIECNIDKYAAQSELEISSSSGNTEVFKFLEERVRGKIPQVIINKCFSYASKNGNIEIVKYILDNYSISTYDYLRTIEEAKHNKQFEVSSYLETRRS